MRNSEGSVLTEMPPLERTIDERDPIYKGGSSPAVSNRQIEDTLGIGRSGTRNRRLRWLLAVTLLILGGALIYWWIGVGPAIPVHFQTQKPVIGDLVLTVTATGNLEAVNTVEVGSEVSGRVESVKVDFNDRVQRNQVLAVLNTERLQAEVKQSEASLASAQASLVQAVATKDEQQFRSIRAEILAEEGHISRQELEGFRATFARAEASLASARAQILVAEASLDVAQSNLGKAEIRSSVEGIVLRRQIEPGQTVAAAFQAPVLFVLAEDLTRMELQVDVDEADVGQVVEGQKATFTVDAYPDHNFPAWITSVHYASQTVAGVVTYKAILSVDNDALLLRPGMTATAEITTETIENAMLIPNSALRFTPPGYESEAPLTEPVVWILQDNKPASIPVTVGKSDGRNTVLQSGDVTPDMPLLINVESSDDKDRSSQSEAVKAAHNPTG